MCSFKPLEKRLEELQCHFTWRFEEHGQLNTVHILQNLGIRISHTTYHIHSILYALHAFLCQRENRYQDALEDLVKAEEFLSKGHQPNSTQSKLLIYGNYAWIYYYLSNYDIVKNYLSKISVVLRSVSYPSHPATLNLDMDQVKGWSYLAIGHRNGEEAAVCFRKALAKEPQNREIKAGLALALYSMTTRYEAGQDLVEEVKTKLWELVHDQPIDYGLRICLALLLKESDWKQAQDFAEDAVQNSQNPEVLRSAAFVYIPRDQDKGMDIFKKAISLCSTYHLLYANLARSFLRQLQKEHSRDERMISASIQAFEQAIKLDPNCMRSQIDLAEVYVINEQHDLASARYESLRKVLPKVSLQTQQMFYLSYGKFLFYTKHLLDEAAQMFKEGFKIPLETKERVQCGWTLSMIAYRFKNLGREEAATYIINLIEESLQAEG